MNDPTAVAGPSGRHRELPSGVADRLPEEAARFVQARRTILDTLALWAYRPVVPPLLEYGEALARALSDPADDAASYKIVDRSSGHVLAIRPDITPQIARMAATRFRDETLPLRLCYEGPVLRHVPAGRGRSRELHQVGAELLGVRDPEADAEAIALCVACLEAAGVARFKVDLGQVEFFRGVVADLDLPPADLDRLRSAVARKDASDLERLLGRLPVPDAKKRLLAELPLLAGGIEVLDRADALVESDHSRRALENLARVVSFVDVHGLTDALTLDLGEIRGIDYHTGVIFEAFVPHLGTPLCRGGRYDGLVGRYGHDLAATGFSLDLSAVLEALLRHGPAHAPAGGVFIVNFAADRAGALALARALRAAGVRAARDLIRRPLEDSLGHARRQGFRWAAVLGEPETAAAEVRLVCLDTGREETLPAERAAARVADEE